jgi:predicted amidophosphoribosyltransferase
VDGFCRGCFSEVLENIPRDGVHLPGLPFPHESLLAWTELDSRPGELVKALKGRHSRRGYRRLAIEMLKRWSPRKALFVVPPSKSGGPDHAWVLAAELASLSGGDFCSPFVAVGDEGEQKAKGRQERQDLKFRLKFKPTVEAFIFVDDLMTTGATAKAAWKALGEPRFSAWTVACRPFQKRI